MLRIARVDVESFLVKLSERGREGGGEMNKFFDELLRDKKKNCIAKQHYINIGGFATQMEAYRLAEKICECLGVSEEHISINERYLEVSQSECEKRLDKAQAAKSKHLPEETT